MKIQSKMRTLKRSICILMSGAFILTSFSTVVLAQDGPTPENSGGVTVDELPDGADAVSVPFGTKQDAIPFPELTADGGKTALENVTWNCGTYHSDQPGEYLFTAVLPEGYIPPESQQQGITVTITVQTPITQSQIPTSPNVSDQGEPRAANQAPNTKTVSLNGSSTFEEAAAGAGISSPDSVNKLIITGKTDGGIWTQADGRYLRENFPHAAELDFSNYKGTFSKYAFSANTQLSKIRLPADSKPSNYMFQDCSGLRTLVCGPETSVSFEDGVIDLTGAVLSDEEYTFSDSGIEKVRLPANANVSYFMFNLCWNLKTLKCGSGRLTDDVIDLSGAASIKGGAFASSSIKNVRLPANAVIPDSIFRSCKNLKSLVCGPAESVSIQDGIIDLTGAASIGNSVFYLSGVVKVRLPADAVIPSMMFMSCDFLSTMVCGTGPFTDGVIDLSGAASIGSSAFESSNVKKVRLPADAVIPSMVFRFCNFLSTMVCGAGPFTDGVIDLSGAASIGSNAFEESNVKKVRLPVDIAIPSKMFANCSYLKTLAFVGNKITPTVDSGSFIGVPNDNSCTLYYPAGSGGYESGVFAAPYLNQWSRKEYSDIQIDVHPSVQNIFDKQDASYSVAAAGSPALSYQWQISTDSGRRWEDLPDTGVYSGAATDTLSLTNVPLAANGSQFRCIVYNDVQTLASNAASLTVKEKNVPQGQKNGSKNGQTKIENQGKGVKTGDETNLSLWIILAASGIGMLSGVWYRKRKCRKH
ncbi:leucine-rich repeat domain-containing protein [[Clostridium] hylemonae]|nr:leucine-rich repeat domain-containing protein [[Clostridium] hylemonae]QEK16057.1 hypothetical protein LAJLEIBI_00024 [[Clostridium] hylemonae DSM 15053]